MNENKLQEKLQKICTEYHMYLSSHLSKVITNSVTKKDIEEKFIHGEKFHQEYKNLENKYEELKKIHENAELNDIEYTDIIEVVKELNECINTVSDSSFKYILDDILVLEDKIKKLEENKSNTFTNQKIVYSTGLEQICTEYHMYLSRYRSKLITNSATEKDIEKNSIRSEKFHQFIEAAEERNENVNVIMDSILALEPEIKEIEEGILVLVSRSEILEEPIDRTSRLEISEEQIKQMAYSSEAIEKKNQFKNFFQNLKNKFERNK